MEIIIINDEVMTKDEYEARMDGFTEWWDEIQKEMWKDISEGE